MELVEGRVYVGDEAGWDRGSYPDVESFVAALDEVTDATGATVQAFDARYVVDREHLERALDLADRERARGEAIARDRAVEVLLYAAGRRQIDRALEMGVGEGETPVVVLVAGGADDGGAVEEAVERVRGLVAPAETVGTYDEAQVREFFGVTDAELAATDATLSDLVRERVALLVVER
jgi:KEOPS complex subunit Cgi121